MSGISIKIDDHEVTALLNKVQARAKRPTAFFKNVGMIVSKSVRHNFDVGGRYSAQGSWRGGTRKWRMLSAQTLLNALNGKRDFKKSGALSKSGRRKAARRVPLNASKRLRDSITYKADSSGAEIGTNVIYAATHNFGAKDRVIRPKTKKTLAFPYNGRMIFAKKVKVTIPARPFLVVQTEDLREIVQTGNKFLTEGK